MQTIIDITLDGESVSPNRIAQRDAGNYGVYRLRLLPGDGQLSRR